MGALVPRSGLSHYLLGPAASAMQKLQRSAAVLALALLCAGNAAADPLEPPYQLDGASVDLRDRGADPAADIQFVFLFDLDPMQAPTQADADRWFEATVLTEAGPVRAGLLEIRKSCAFLCGVEPSMPVEEAETCHYQAALVLHPETDTAGANLIAAFPGKVEIADFQMPAPAPLRAAPAWSRAFHAPAWPPDETGGIRIDGWDPNTRRLQYTLQAMGEEQSFHEPGCEASTAAGLTQIQCQSLALIAADGVPLLLSVPDYNQAIATPVASFMHDGTLHVVVRLGLKAQTVYGLLVKRGDTWVPLFRKAERSLLC
jgi:hypothetical protein